MLAHVVVAGEPKPSVERIFTVHTLRSPGPGYGGDRTPGFFCTLDEAKECVEENHGDIHEMVYKYVVIEEFGPGLYFIPEHEWWYIWEGNNKTGKYVSCEKPEEFQEALCFGLG